MSRKFLFLILIGLLALTIIACGLGGLTAKTTEAPTKVAKSTEASAPTAPTPTPAPSTNTGATSADTPTPSVAKPESTQAVDKTTDKLEPPDFPGGDKLSEKDLADAEAGIKEMAQTFQLTDYTWKGWKVPTETTWEEANDYYQKFFKESGRKVEHSLVQEDTPDMKMGIFLDQSNKTLMMIVLGEEKGQRMLGVAVGQMSSETAATLGIGLDQMNQIIQQATEEAAATTEPTQEVK